MKDKSKVAIYEQKLKEAQKKVALIEAQLNGKYNEILIQQRNNLYADIDGYRKKIAWYGNKNKEKLEQQHQFNVEILKP
jgi:ribosome-associated translation inhibitor RaiA